MATPDSAAAFIAGSRMIATPQMSLLAAADVARAAGITPVLLGDALEGEARELGIVIAGIAKAATTHGTPAPAPMVLLSGGEVTVSIGDTKPGRGGRNTGFLLSLSVALQGNAHIHAVAADTDGIDGTEDAAGAVIGPDTLARALATGFDPKATLLAHHSYSLFDATGDLGVEIPPEDVPSRQKRSMRCAAVKAARSSWRPRCWNR